MDQYIKLIASTTCILILSSCAVSLRTTDGEGMIEEVTSSNPNDSFIFQIRDVLCEEDTLLIDPCAYKRILPWHLEQCLRSKGYNGDMDANSTIKALYQFNSDLRFRADLPPFRGRDLFEFFLYSSNDFEWIVYQRTGTEDYTTPSPYSKAGVFKSFFFQTMVDSIGDYPASHYHSYVAQMTGYYKWQLPPISAEADSIHYVHIRDAWEQGLIKLKPYGEE